MREGHRQLLLLVGAFLNAFPLSMQSYFGNLLPYIDSYYYAHRHSISLHVDPLWTSSIFVCTFIIGMIVSTPIEQCLGIRKTLAMADVIMSFMTISGYFTVREPLALAVVFGGSQGTCVGIAYSMMIKLVLSTIPEHGGKATGIMSAGPVFGALIFVGVAYAVINPHNASPDIYVDDKVYFSDKGVIDRVPKYFLVVGAMTVMFTLTGMTLIILGTYTFRQDDDEEKEVLTMSQPVYTEETCFDIDNNTVVGSSDEDESVPLKVAESKDYSNGQLDKLKKPKNPQNGATSNGHGGIVREIRSEELIQLNGNTNTKPRPTELSDLSPGEAIKTARFWLVWIAYLSSNHTNYIHLNLYKRYGQRVILNDSLLVTAGMISNAVVIVVRPMVGVFSDKFGIRSVNVILNAASCLFMSLMVIVLHTCPWIYVVLVIAEYMGVSPHTMLFSLLTTYEFGKTHCGSNMGLIRSGNILLVLMEPVVVDLLIATVGWDWLFLSGAFTSVVATVAIVALDYCKV